MEHGDVLALAARQHGLAHRQQLSALGVSESALRNLVDRGVWRWRSGSVLEHVGAIVSDEQLALLAVLDLGQHAALSHHSAASLWGLPGFLIRPFHVTGNRTRGRSHRTVGIVHQPRLLSPEHVVVLYGIPVTTPTRTLFDLAAVVHPLRLERALEHALREGLTTIAALRAMLRQLARKGRPGIRVMRKLLEDRPLDYVPTGSNLELRFQDLARQAGITTLARQVDVGDDYDWIGRVDFVDRARKVIVEVQSSRFHDGLLDVARDERRFAALRASGWTVVEIKEHDIWYEPDKVIRDLRAAFW